MPHIEQNRSDSSSFESSSYVLHDVPGRDVDEEGCATDATPCANTEKRMCC